ncbi:MAG: ABC transporter ATP-binding protein, partial [Planctomycetes bacterium]|nr:ABC transporter ATP-binding protein [Planctomycetota bacterium]
GAGKTTLLRVLARQVEIERGQVWLDGIDLCDLGRAQLRRAIGMVTQESFLFSTTLAENVALGAPRASRAEIDAAVAKAQLDTDLAQLPDGLDTVVGERGVKLSGGQRQRAALARVLLLQPKLLLLDDIVSAIDTATAARIHAALQPLRARCTTVVVAHRIASVLDADEILVLDRGRVVERGNHAALVARGGLYADLFHRQSRREALEQELHGLGGDGLDAATGRGHDA